MGQRAYALVTPSILIFYPDVRRTHFHHIEADFEQKSEHSVFRLTIECNSTEFSVRGCAAIRIDTN